MKTVILAGGHGTRIGEESAVRPKPMIDIGNQPILWHIMKIYSFHGINDFVVCLGHQGRVIREYFANYTLNHSDVTFDLSARATTIHQSAVDPWRVTLIDTGEDTMTGGRLKRVRQYVGDETFCLTYGDGVSDVNIADLVAFHRAQGTYATLTAVQPAGRFGAFSLHAGDQHVRGFKEKPKGDGAWVNGGFFVCEPQVFDYIDSDDTVWESEPMEHLSRDGQLSAFRHDGFWQSMDTLRDRVLLEQLWNEGRPPWKIW
jgi:glucose-1-phosphate cytidylyltransferase